MRWPEDKALRADLEDWRPEAEQYFETYADGRYDSAAYLHYIYPAERLRRGDDGTSLVIGSAGVDGLEFALRRGSPAVWVYYPIDDAWQELAPDITRFDLGWSNGSITV